MWCVLCCAILAYHVLCRCNKSESSVWTQQLACCYPGWGWGMEEHQRSLVMNKWWNRKLLNLKLVLVSSCLHVTQMSFWKNNERMESLHIWSDLIWCLPHLMSVFWKLPHVRGVLLYGLWYHRSCVSAAVTHPSPNSATWWANWMTLI